MKVLVTGAAGFIGMHCIERLLARGDTVVGIDNLNDYYKVSLKESRLARIADHPAFTNHIISIEDRDAMADLFKGDTGPGHPSRGAGRCALFPGEPPRLCRCQPGRLHEHP